MEYDLCCPCLLGLEGLVAEELREMGCQNVRPENGRVLLDGNPKMIARVNINSRYAERVLILLKSFRACTFTELFDNVNGIPWELFLSKVDEFPVSGSSLVSALHSIPDCQSIIKKAIVERLKSKYKINWFKETGPLHRVKFLILKDEVKIMIDTSGNGLHKRGYRKNSTEAPIKETLAAAMAKIARLHSDGNMIDPLCGSGTILIESAMLMMKIAPGLNRHFVAEKWTDSSKQVWEKERARARSMEMRGITFQATGYDIDPEAVALTLDNAAKAGVLSAVRAEVRDIASFDETPPYGCVITNPPYGERLLDIRGAEDLYRLMGKLFAKKKGWSYHIISPHENFEAIFGRRADKRRKLYNGMIKCQVYQYFKT